MIDFEEVAQVPSDASMKRLATLADELVARQKCVADLEARVKAEQTLITRIQEQDLPSLMDEIGVAKFTLSDGSEVVVDEQTFASISKANQPDAFNWLRGHGFGGLIKNTVSVEFGKGQDTEATKLVEKLMEEHYKKVGHKEDVHWQTLRAFVKEQKEAGTPVPNELFGVFTKRIAVVSINK